MHQCRMAQPDVGPHGALRLLRQQLGVAIEGPQREDQFWLDKLDDTLSVADTHQFAYEWGNHADAVVRAARLGGA